MIADADEDFSIHSDQESVSIFLFFFKLRIPFHIIVCVSVL